MSMQPRDPATAARPTHHHVPAPIKTAAHRARSPRAGESWQHEVHEAGTRAFGQCVRQAWWLATFPGLAISALVPARQLFGDSLRDALDPVPTRAAKPSWANCPTARGPIYA